MKKLIRFLMKILKPPKILKAIKKRMTKLSVRQKEMHEKKLMKMLIKNTKNLTENLI